MKLYIEIWTDSHNREQGISIKKLFKGFSLETQKYMVEHTYNNYIKRKGGSIEILNTNHETLFHISEDSNHELELVKKNLVKSN